MSYMPMRDTCLALNTPAGAWQHGSGISGLLSSAAAAKTVIDTVDDTAKVFLLHLLLPLLPCHYVIVFLCAMTTIQIIVLLNNEEVKKISKLSMTERIFHSWGGL